MQSPMCALRSSPLLCTSRERENSWLCVPLFILYALSACIIQLYDLLRQN